MSALAGGGRSRQGRVSALGSPRLHFRQTDSTNARAKALAEGGAVHGTLVTADAQSDGRGRQGRKWVAPARSALLMSLVLREWDALLPLRAGVAVSELVDGSLVKWPNDVLVDGRKVAGVLVEGRPGSGWAVLGIGLNVVAAPEGVSGAGALGLGGDALELTLAALLGELAEWLPAPVADVGAALSERDALLGQPVSWSGGSGVGDGIEQDGSLRVRVDSGAIVLLESGEVHLAAEDRAPKGG